MKQQKSDGFFVLHIYCSAEGNVSWQRRQAPCVTVSAMRSDVISINCDEQAACCSVSYRYYFGTSVGTKQWALTVSAGVHSIKTGCVNWRLRHKFRPRQSLQIIPITDCSWKNEQLCTTVRTAHVIIWDLSTIFSAKPRPWAAMTDIMTMTRKYELV